MKVPKAVVLLLLAVTFAFADHSSKRPRCVPVHIISVRGTNEKPGEGKIGRIAAAIAAEHPGTKRDALEYPARIFPYEKSSAEGIAALTKELATLVKRCSKSQIVLLGYSQGAHVIGDTLCGGGGLRGIGPATKPIPKKVGDHVAAVILIGDPRYVVNQTYNVGNANNNGLFPRQRDQSCELYAKRIRSYCDDGDTFCERGRNLKVHYSYIEKYLDDAVAFVNGRLRS